MEVTSRKTTNDSNKHRPSDRGLVIFSHGHRSSPLSRKIQVLSPVAHRLGFATEALDYQDLDDNPVGRVERLVSRLEDLPADRSGPLVLVGSSMGGYVSTMAAERQAIDGLLLLAPALYLEHLVEGGVTARSYHPRCPRISVVHGWQDDIIPWENAVRFAESVKAELQLIDSDHRLDSALPLICTLFERLLQDCLNQPRSV